MLLPALERAGSEKPAISENPAISEKPAIIQQLGTPDKAPREARVARENVSLLSLPLGQMCSQRICWKLLRAVVSRKASSGRPSMPSP